METKTSGFDWKHRGQLYHGNYHRWHPPAFSFSLLQRPTCRWDRCSAQGQDPMLLSRSPSLLNTTPYLGGISNRLSPSSAAFGSGIASQWQHLHLPLRFSHPKPEQARACFACLIWQGHPAHSSPYEALGFLIWFISCHFGHFVLLWLASASLHVLPSKRGLCREGGRVRRRKEGKNKGLQRYSVQYSEEDANLNKSGARKICFLGLLTAWENSCLLPAAQDPSRLLLQAMLHVWSFLSLKMNSCALPSKYSSTSAHYCASNWTHMSRAFFSWHDWWCLCTTLGSCWVLNNTSWPERQWW